MMKHLGILFLFLLASMSATAQIARKDSVPLGLAEVDQKVIVSGDTISIVLPQKNYGRYDRGLFNFLYIPKGEWAFGFTASYGELNTEDIQILSMLKNVDLSGKLYSLKPSVSYFFNHNQSIGMRLNFTRGEANLHSLAVDIDEDMNFELKDVSYYSHSYDLGVVYRNYVGLDKRKRFSVFNEVSLDFGSGSSRFKRYYNNELRDTRTNSMGVSLNFSPGLCVFVQDFVAFNVSFGVFGIKVNKEKQLTNGIEEGTRVSSGANFKFNIFNINFGLMVVI